MKKAFVIVILAGFVMSPAYADKPDHANGRGLPPGLQKKVERGGELPPGWQRKLRKGQVLDSRVYKEAVPIDESMHVKLPLGPNGTVDLEIEGKIVRIYEATRIIQAVFNDPRK